ncbi:TonB-dependent receptor SusC [Mesonia oceanica]|uniref:TonB-dependent receptor SusC n=1 Tax=Mesonia oceanica TaxID=2687242 RepID=A0AC61YCY5_9FLAO|nr:TonB-dependent receptor SusC [Mesonia oceanica]|tara:strand:- start:16947 stop:19457 length:2511 start_codon:yes stop_codon:yes gene_type:complete
MKFFVYMKYYYLLCLLFVSSLSFAQTKAGGYVKDSRGEPVPFANVLFVNSSVGTITNDDGSFYIETEKSYDALQVSFLGFQTQTIPLEKSASLNLEIILEEEQNALDEIVIYQGKTSKKNNPAIDILRKIWENRRDNGIYKFDQYQYKKYEKQEFDLNTIDSALINSRIFKGMEFIFEETDTNAVTGKTYLPIFINEAVYRVYGNNESGKKKEVLIGNKNSGFSDNQTLIEFVKDLYKEYNVYDNYLKFFDKSFVSPLSTTGINVYNYVLADSTFIDNKWCYKIVYYPRRKNELTFKGDFWVNDSTWAIKKIKLAATKSANINWVRDIYIEQDFDVLNDSIFLITRDHFMSDFAFRKKDDARGVYGKRTTLYDEYAFDIERREEFYENNRDQYIEKVYNRDSTFWQQNRLEPLNNDEQKVYTMLDTLKTVRAFQRLYNIGSVLASGYIELDNFDYGPIFSTFGYNDVEGIRVRAGGRTYFGRNDPWRIEGYTAYGFKDNKFKYGLSGKILVDPRSRLILSGGNRRDVEQLGASLTNTNDVLGRSLASSSLITVGANMSLTNINLSTFSLEAEPWKNVNLRVSGSYRTLESASDEFSLAYYTNEERTKTASEINQTEISTILTYSPGRKTAGYGVERIIINEGDYPRLFLNYAVGIKGPFSSDFDYEKLQFYYRHPWQLGGFGKLTTTFEAGKTFGEVPLGLLNVVPGNQTLFSIFGTYPLLDYYEFVTDTYTSLHLEHNFNGRFFGRIPLIRDLNLRELIAVRAVMGSISDENQLLNASTSHPVLFAPENEPYWSYSLGIGNIFKVFRLDFHFRGNYFDNPDARSFGITGSFGFYF